MHATDVDSEIEIHFDITGNSVTEGKMSDMRSCFTDRLEENQVNDDLCKLPPKEADPRLRGMEKPSETFQQGL